jgi:hypothetical protein
MSGSAGTCAFQVMTTSCTSNRSSYPLQHAVAAPAKLGLRALSNNVNAIRLYERYGFTEEGRLKAELRRPDGSYADDIWMALWLRPPAMGTPAAT